jgi:signal transduction histidine kinase/CheY-like chemotaxis protein
LPREEVTELIATPTVIEHDLDEPGGSRSVLIVDADGIIHGVACAGALPQPGAELGHESITRRVPREIGPSLCVAIESAVATRASRVFEYTVNQGASARCFEVTVAPLALGGDSTLACVTLVDVTPERSAIAARAADVEQLARAQRMQDIGRLTGGIAHDFNNVLAGVLGFVRLAERALSAGHPERVPHYLGEIAQAGERARDMTTQMLTFSRGSVTTSERVDVTAVARATLALLRRSIPTSIELSLNVDDTAHCVDANATQLEQVLLNLGVNAREALGEHGHIALGVSRRTDLALRCDSCHREAHGDWIVLTVSDDGPGIAGETRARLFDPFYGTRDGNSGMGLAVTHGIVHQHGGHLRVMEAPGGGTCFEVLLPEICAMREATSADATATVAPTAGLNVLLVDDDPAVARALGELLRLEDCVVTIVHDGDAALARLREASHACDVLLTDQNLPGLDGITLVRRAREARPELRAILMSGFGAAALEARAREAGVDAVIGKPADADALLRVITGLGRAA